MRRDSLIAAFAALSVAGACAGSSSTSGPGTSRPGPSRAAGQPGAGVPSTVPPALVTTTTARPPITLAFAGDIHFEGALDRKLRADPRTVLAPIAPVLSAADLAVANLETAITDRGEPEPKQFTFRAPATAFQALAAAGLDAVSAANNHGLDYGPVSATDGLAAARAAKFPVVGLGRNQAEAYAPFLTTISGWRVALVGATQVLDDDLMATWLATDTRPGLASAKDTPRLLTAVRAARAEADTVVVYLHWGVEGQTCPTTTQTGLARQLVDAGADIVVGSHAHRLEGAGRMGNAVVAYGLGNFAFYARSGPGTESGVLTVTVEGRKIDSYSWAPAVLEGGVPNPLTGAEAERARTQWAALRSCTGLDP